MISLIPLTPRWAILYSVTTISALTILCLKISQEGLSSLSSLHDSLSIPSNPFFSSSSSCSRTCSPDPFSRRGILSFPSPQRYNETRWIPLPELHASLQGETPQVLKLGDIDYTGHIPSEIEEGLAQPLTAKLNREEVLSDAGEDELGWLKGRMVIFLDDRNNVEQLCGELHGVSKSWGGHLGGYCHIERIDLTLVWWFLYGLVDDENLDEWRKLEARPITFENRIKDVFLPAMKSAGLDRTPDLVVVSSLFWDEGFIRDYPLLYPPTPPLPANHRDRPGFLLGQIQWHQSRLSQLFTYLRETYHQDLPLMFRTRHIRSNMQYGGGLKIAQIDQGAREVCEQMGVRQFRWGDLLEGISE
nr:uncharacterized protein I303_08095 [Kwoniella dejecticola CBS 10117]OBR82181.1 hypothetical protein I303_08095 [Kwoniella dejecticola CBS 10117]